ncbi:MAG: exodeoxyribonuclease V subunit gamma [Desulfocapsa sp.]|nr:exodeoxyribonuclease V subunit gamma [Desulfocapsa sp.]MBN4045941.1 exodeoxyribonuclease V subunit gamma [bacterium AH-315-P11]
MFYLHLSNKSENLIRHLVEVLHLDDKRDPFVPEYFLIQSQGMERMLSQRLAERFVSWCNYEYMLPTRFFALMADRLGVETGAEEYARDQLCWRIEQILRGVSGDTFRLLIRYMAHDASGMKRYQLAQQLAYVFDQYQIMRLAMMDGWEQGKRFTENPAEIYQMELWKLLGEEIGHVRHRGVFLRDLIHHLNEKSDLSSVLPKRLSVFGVHSLPPILLSCLQALSNHCDIHFYLLSPCETYWTEQMPRRMQLNKSLSDSHSSGHPLLASLGQQGREFQQMLLQDVQFSGEFKSFAAPFDEDEDEQKNCLLHWLQRDLLQGELRFPEKKFVKDDSVIISSTHSPHREIMVLKDRILYWLDHNPDLMLKDIVVMAPDIQEYSGLIPAIFHDVPHSIADRNPAHSNSFIVVFLQFLTLCTSRFGWEEVLDLFEKEEVYPCFELHENDLELIRHWVVSSGVRWGLSAAQKRNSGLSDLEECTWRSGLDRLMMGYAVGGTSRVDGILPYQDMEGSLAAPLGGLALFCEILEQACETFAKPHTLEQWSEILVGYVDSLLISDGGDALLELHTILSGLGQGYGSCNESSHSFEVICSWLEGAAEEKKSSSGFLRGQLTFCSMLPMRSIPFRKVCLLGLNDTVFPKNDQHPPFDLLGDRIVPGDRSRRSDDRYQFLEAILSARESLYLSYVGQSIRSNDPLPPSAVISELIELVQLYGVVDLVDHHPLHGFSKRYFTKESSLFSYKSKLLEVSIALGEAPPPVTPWWQGKREEEKIEHVTIDELFVFFQNPQKYFVKNILGVALGGKNVTLEEHEPFVLDPLQKYLVDQDLVEGALNGLEQETLRDHLQAAGQWPLAAPGDVEFERKQEEQHSFITRVQEQSKLGRSDDEYIDIVLSGVRITGRLDSLYPNASFLFRYAKCKGKDLLRTWLHHCFSTVCLGKNVDTRLLMKDAECLFPAGTAKKKDLQDLLALFLQGQHAPSSIMVEPAVAYSVQSEKTEKSGKGDPAAKAMASVANSLNKGMEPEWELLFSGQQSEEYMDHNFFEQCEWFYQSIWKRANVRNF